MSKAEITFLLKKIYELGLYFMKVTETIKDKNNDYIIVEKWVSIAHDQGFRDEYGKPDYEGAKDKIIKDRVDALKRLYYKTKTELEIRGDSGRLLGETEERSKLNNLTDNFDEVLYWVEKNLRYLGIIVSHDRFWKSTYLSHDNIPIGSKILSEKQAMDQEQEYNEKDN